MLVQFPVPVPVPFPCSVSKPLGLRRFSICNSKNILLLDFFLSVFRHLWLAFGIRGKFVKFLKSPSHDTPGTIPHVTGPPGGRASQEGGTVFPPSRKDKPGRITHPDPLRCAWLYSGKVYFLINAISISRSWSRSINTNCWNLFFRQKNVASRRNLFVTCMVQR